MSQNKSPLYPLLDEINAAATHGAPLVAVAMTVALPDICVSLISPDGRSTGERYRAWCEENLDKRFGFLTAEDLWSMRCGVLHNGRFGDLKHNVARVIFALPGTGMTMVNCRVNDAYVYSVVDFCRNFTEIVYSWAEEHRDHDTYKINIEHLMQYRFGGLSPYFSGITVLA